MRILLVGEYSRFHNSLKEGLTALGHQTTIIGTGDDFKNYPIDIDISPKLTQNNFLFRVLKKIFRILFKIDISATEIGIRCYLKKKALCNYDVVQLINSHSIKTHPWLEKKILGHIFKYNKKVFLSACGSDYYNIDFMLKSKVRYSILTPFFTDNTLKKVFWYDLKYATKPYKILYQFVEGQVKAIIPIDIDYVLPLANNPKATNLIPSPINVDMLPYNPIKINDQINIFHGINSYNYFKKGNNYFEDALLIIQKKYNEKINIKTSFDIPYKEYIMLYNNCHIVLDQIFGFDQGYNALEAMAKGKVVFTGAEKEWLKNYGIKENTVAINALPNVEYIVDNLSQLIDNPERIEKIGLAARKFVEKEHHYIKIAQKYVDTWESF